MRPAAPRVSAIGLVGSAAVAIALLFAVPTSVWAQVQELSEQRLGRAYWHVFSAYALVWILVAGWVISINRRLARVEKRLDDTER